jgi:lipopolysaccharide transport system ATP-binding protein
MSSSDLMISVRGLSKSYTIRHNTNDHITIAELALDRIKHPLHRTPREEFWALQDIDLDVHRGEVLGLIGRNGAGKSTLLKVLTRITEPTKGRIELWGRVGSLLEVGTGFHPELTGRENVYLNGSILGMTRKDIEGQFDDIVDFAGVEKFLDTPVKRYSSGMYVRLAFAVAAHLDSEILLLDEVLAVGDAAFQERCLQRISELATTGRTVVLVAHSASVIAAVTQRSVLLEVGRIGLDGPTALALERHAAHAGSTSKETTITDLPRPPGLGQLARMVDLAFEGNTDSFPETEPIAFSIDVDVAPDCPRPLAFSQAIHPIGAPKLGSIHPDRAIDLPDGRSRVKILVKDHHLAPGRYSVGLGLATGPPDSEAFVDLISKAGEFSIEPGVDDQMRVWRWDENWGHVRFNASEARLA